MALVFCDLDGTLLRGLSSEKRFFGFLLRSRALGLRQLAAFLIYPLHEYTRLRKEVWKKNKAYLYGLSQTKIKHLAEQFVSQALLADLRPVMKRRLENHLTQGDIVVLLTGTPDFIAWPIAKQLGIAHVAATICDTIGDRFTSNPPGIHPFGTEKVHIAHQISHNFNTILAECTAYADTISDIALLASVLRPVVVYPNRKMRQIAIRCGWEIVG